MSLIETGNPTPTSFGIREQVAVRLATVRDLTAKVLEELRDWRQFTDPERRRDLWFKGRRSLGAATSEIVVDISQAISEIEQSTVWGQSSEGLEAGISRQVGLATVIVPADWKVFYYHPGRADADAIDAPNSRFKMVSTTITSRMRKIGGKKRYSIQNDYPTQGYKDSERVRVPFKYREPSSHIQHGGLLINNTTQQVRILDYAELTTVRAEALSPNQVIMEANWYISSENFEQVLKRSNLRQPRPYNCLGTMILDNNQQRMFTLSCDNTSFNPTEQYFGLIPEGVTNGVYGKEVTMAQLAAMSTILARRYNAKSWRLAGMEFIGGGLIINNPWLSYRDFFAFLPSRA